MYIRRPVRVKWAWLKLLTMPATRADMRRRNYELSGCKGSYRLEPRQFNWFHCWHHLLGVNFQPSTTRKACNDDLLNFRI